jgi:hypothetical protein
MSAPSQGAQGALMGNYEGAFASWPIAQNLEARAPFRSVNAGVHAWTSDSAAGGVLQGRFAWGDPSTGTTQNIRVTAQDAQGIVIPFRSLNGANGGVVGGPKYLAGWQASYTWEFYDPTATPWPFGGLRVRPGLVVTMHDRGNFWLRFAGGGIAGNTVYASLVDGSAVSGLPTAPPANCEATPFLVCYNIMPGQLGIVSSAAFFTP